MRKSIPFLPALFLCASWASANVDVPLAAAFGPGGTRITERTARDGREITISSVVRQAYSDSAYAVAPVQANASGYCLLHYSVDGQASRVSLLDQRDQVVASFSSSGQFRPMKLPFRLDGKDRYRLVFYKIERIDVPVVYKGVRLDCAADASRPDAREFALLGIDAYARASVHRMGGESDRAALALKAQFTDIARTVRQKNADSNNPYNLAFYLVGEFRRIKGALRAAYPKLREQHLWAFFCMNVAHYATPLTRQDKDLARDVLLDGGGTCWQQASVAVFFHNLVQGDQASRVMSSDPYVLGHAFFAGSDFVADVTNNIFLPLSAVAWNKLEPVERMRHLQSAASYGLSLDVHGGRGRPESLALFSQQELEAGYADTVKALPFARLMEPQTFSVE